MKKFISIILTFILSISIILLSGLSIIKSVVNKDTIMEIIMPDEGDTSEISYIVDNTMLAYATSNPVYLSKEDLKNMDYNELKSISNNVSKMHELLDSTFKSKDLPTELIDYIVKDSDYKKEVSNYIEQYISYTTGEGEKPVINQAKVNEVLNNNIEVYEKETGKKVNTKHVDTLTTEISETIDDKVSNIVDNSGIKNVLNLLYSKTVLITLIVVTIISIILLVVINLNTSVLYYLGTSLIINGIVYLIVRFGVKNIVIDGFEELVKLIVDKVMPSLNLISILSLVIGILLVVIKVVLNKKVKKNN